MEKHGNLILKFVSNVFVCANEKTLKSNITLKILHRTNLKLSLRSVFEMNKLKLY